jgi:integrase
MVTVRKTSSHPQQWLGAAAPYESSLLYEQLITAMAHMRFRPADCQPITRTFPSLCQALEGCAGQTLQERWQDFEQRIWPVWLAGQDRPPGKRWTGAVHVAITTRLVQPGWDLLCTTYTLTWVKHLSEEDPLVQQADLLLQTLQSLAWAKPDRRLQALNTALRLLLVHGYASLWQITEQDLLEIPPAGQSGSDTLDAALCTLGIFSRTPQRAISRHARQPRRSPAEMVEAVDMPEHFRPITTLYLETFARRISAVYGTLQHKVRALARFWRFLAERYPEVRSCSEVLPQHARAFVPYAIEQGRRVQRNSTLGGDDRTTVNTWLIDLRTFFADICTWAAEADSPFAPYAPRMIPLTRHDLVGVGFEQARKRSQARLTTTVLDLEREMPNIRAYALRRWTEAEEASKPHPSVPRKLRAARETFWDWAVLELLVQSGLRIEEASELTTLDVLKRHMPDGRVYYLLHVKPSKYDRARVIPIGDGLGRVIAEIIRHVKQFYGTATVPFCDHWDKQEKTPLPRAPYLLQGAGYPSPMSIETIRDRLRRLSMASGARTADGSPLILHPHDCRRVFASEHLNNNTPVHVIQALLGHATLDTIMVYAKLYPTHLVEEYRKTLHGAYRAVHGEESFRNPTAEEWAAFTQNCSLRDMGTHLCALPTGEHCPKGLVCLGCVHAQPKKSAIPVFRRMAMSHERELQVAKKRGEPAGQLAARELEVERIRQALRRAEELTMPARANTITR